MKVFDLQCQLQHVFEGWFGSEEDFISQLDRGLIACPMCGDGNVIKKLSAPRLNLGFTSKFPSFTNQETQEKITPVVTDAVVPESAMAQAWMAVVRQVLASTEDVGSKFAEEARKIHYGETEERGIRGQATAQERQSLVEEGIDVVALTLPEVLKGPLH